MPISLHHAQVFYPPGEEAKARAFYGTALGLAEITRPVALSDRDGLWFAAGEGQVHLSAQADLALHGRRHFALKIDDLDATRAKLATHGARFEEATPIPGWRRCYVFDPFGNKIELDEIPARR
jgi:catechol 2,3-dioxygenase-like lactoylglutathione lyase family enzyme